MSNLFKELVEELKEQESIKLKKLAGKITKVPKTINVPIEYTLGENERTREKL